MCYSKMSQVAQPFLAVLPQASTLPGRSLANQRKNQHKLVDEIVGRLARRHSTAVVLFHHAVAERLGLGPTDHKCLDLLRERGAMAGSDLGAITGLTSGANTGVVARLEGAGYLRREPDQHDGRKQILHLALQPMHIHDALAPLRKDVAAQLEDFDSHQLTAIAKFLVGTTALVYSHAALLRAETISAVGRTPATKRTPSSRPPSERSKMRVKR